MKPGQRRRLIFAASTAFTWIADSPGDPDFTRLSVLAARLLDAPVGFIGLLNGDQVQVYAPSGQS